MGITIVYEEQLDGTWSGHVEGITNVPRVAKAGNVAAARHYFREQLSYDKRAKGHDLEERIVRRKKS